MTDQDKIDSFIQECEVEIKNRGLTVGKYFYLSSKGVIHPTWVQRDVQADKFRKTVGNYHQTKAAAEKYRNSLVAKVK